MAEKALTVAGGATSVFCDRLLKGVAPGESAALAEAFTTEALSAAIN
jgi:hypothetical protein